MRVALIGLIAGSTVDSGSALQSARSAPTGLHHRRRPQQPGSGSGRVGHRGNQGAAHQLHQDCRHRRSGPLHGAGTARRHLSGVGQRLRPRRFDADPDEAGHDSDRADRDAGQNAAGSGEGLSGRLLAVAARAARRRGISRHRRARQRARTEHADPEPLDQLDQVRLQLLPSARQPADAQHRPRPEGEARAQDPRGGLGVAARHRRPRHVDVRRAHQSGQGAIAQGLCRLDRTRRQGRGAAGAAAAQRHRAEPRRDLVGRRRRPFVHARRSLDRQEPSDGECQRTHLRGLGRPRPARRCWIRTSTRRGPSTFRPARRGRRFRPASPRRAGRRCIGATSICGPIRRTTRPIPTTRCSTARAACG